MNKSAVANSFIEINGQSLNIPYTVCEVLVAIIAVIGNAMVIIVFRKERRLRRRTNYYIVSLAIADFLVGLLGIPFAILASVGLPTNLHACLFTVSLLVMLCTISIFCLVAVSVDRYWAILYPMGYSRNVRTKTALVIISICWVAGMFVGFLPLLGWHKGKNEDQKCFFVGVMDYNYLVFLYFATIITPSLVLAAFYAHIYRVVLKQLRRIVTMNPSSDSNGNSTSANTNANSNTNTNRNRNATISPANGHIRVNGGTMLRMLGAAQKREVKATQNLSIIVLFFMICWIPLYTINCVQAFCIDCQINGTLLDFCIILSHLNSAGNPLLYAYHLRDFRAALKYYILSLFGIKEHNTLCMDRSCRPSLTSHNCSHRLKYFRSTNVESTFGRTFANSKTRSAEGRRRIPYCVPIVASTTTVAAVSAGERGKQDMWMIKEIPSSSLSENNADLERDVTIFPDGAPVVPDLGSSVSANASASDLSSSGQINSGFIEDPLEDFALAIGDDEVFYADASTLSANDFPSESSSLYKQYNWAKLSKTNNNPKCLSNSSPQLSRSLYVVETDILKSNHSDTEPTTYQQFSPSKSLKSTTTTNKKETSIHKYLFKKPLYSKSANKIEQLSFRDLSNMKNP